MTESIFDTTYIDIFGNKTSIVFRKAREDLYYSNDTNCWIDDDGDLADLIREEKRKLEELTAERLDIYNEMLYRERDKIEVRYDRAQNNVNKMIRKTHMSEEDMKLSNKYINERDMLFSQNSSLNEKIENNENYWDNRLSYEEY
jgi:hypothetical protein